MIDPEAKARLWHQVEQHLRGRNVPAANAAIAAASRLESSDAVALLRIAQASHRVGLTQVALDYAVRACDRSMPDEASLLELVGLLSGLGEPQRVLSLCRSPMVRRSVSAETLVQVGRALYALSAFEDILPLLERARELELVDANLEILAGETAAATGDLAAARAAYERATTLRPSGSIADYHLSRMGERVTTEERAAGLEARIATAEGSPRERSYLHFALFNELDSLGRHDAAWAALMAGCELKRSTLDHDAAAESAMVDALIAATGRPPAEARDPESAGALPIFIVGLPRTGSTLLERLLSNHPDVASAGELFDFHHQLHVVGNSSSHEFWTPRLIRLIDRLDYAALGERYLARTRWRANGRRRFVDKLPQNFLFVDAIVRALPGARILHVHRGAMETCFSNLKFPFAESFRHTYRMDELAAHYADYRRLLAHWHRRHPGRVLDVAYEDLVGQPEEVMAKVFEYCGLPAASGCTDLSRNAAPVATGSALQVRSAITRDFNDHWRRYARHLEPLRAALASRGLLEPPDAAA